jgi:indole-3-glycerol phosphate synthase
MSELQKTDILAEIIATKRKELAARVEAHASESDLRAIPFEGVQAQRSRSLRRALLASPTGIIAEFKRKSPSRGWIHADARPEEVVPAYAAAGAAALSILTDETYFGGSLEFIRRVRPLVDLPILRKDFIIDPVQLAEARQAGADAVLLIAACLSRGDCAALTAEAHRLGLEVLLEIHSSEELDYITPDIDVVGVNNRHLGTFVTDVRTSFELASRLKEIPGQARNDYEETRNDYEETRNDYAGARNDGDNFFAVIPAEEPESPVFISESGISEPGTVRALREAGYRGFLMGENFMKHDEPGAALASFIQAI